MTKESKHSKINLELGRVPPSNVDAEELILSAILVDGENSLMKVADTLNPDMFYKDTYGVIYKSFISLFNDSTPIDMMTVAKRLMETKDFELIGGAYALSEISCKIASANNIEYHAAIIHEQYIKRQVINECSKLINMAYDSSIDCDDLINSSIGITDRVLEHNKGKSKVSSLEDGLCEVIEGIKEAQISKKDGSVILRPHTSELRQVKPTYEPGELIIIAARPSMGKTAYVLSIALNFANQGIPGIFYSLEMTTKELAQRALSADGGVSKHIYEDGQMDDMKWSIVDNGITKINNYPLLIDDTPLATYAHIKTTSKILSQQKGIKYIIIDYLQLMGTDMSIPREQQISLISRQLKALAKEIEVPIFVLSQLNRGSESRQADGFKPKMSDLRESGAIEQDADCIQFPHRPEYYYPKDQEFKGKGLIIFGKNRGGSVGEVNINVSPDCSRWTGQEEVIIDVSFEDVQNNFESEKPF